MILNKFIYHNYKASTASNIPLYKIYITLYNSLHSMCIFATITKPNITCDK